MRRDLAGARRSGRAAGTSRPSVPPVPMEVWVSIGDSEMAGSGSNLTGSGLPEFYPPADGSAYMIRGFSGSMVELAEPSNSAVGPDGMFAWYRQRQLGTSKVCSVQCGVASTTSTAFMYDANPVSNFQKTVAAANLAMAQPGAVFGGFLIYGGANDASLGSPAWGTNWTSAITSLRAAITGAASAIVLYAQLPTGTPHSNYSLSWATVRSQQAAWAAADRIMFVVDPAGPWISSPQDATNLNFLVHQATSAANTLALQFASNFGAIPAIPAVAPSTVAGIVFDAATIQQSGGFVDALTDTVRSKSFTATLTTRPAYSANDVNWSNLPTPTWDASNDEMGYSGPLSDFSCMHSGLGGTMTFACRYTAANADLFSTRDNPAFPGILIRFSGGSMMTFCYGIGGTAYNGNTTQAIPLNTRFIVQFRLQTGLLQQRINGQPWVSAPFYNAVTLVTSDPQFVKLGHQFYRFAGQIPRCVMHNKFLTDAEANAVANALTVALL